MIQNNKDIEILLQAEMELHKALTTLNQAFEEHSNEAANIMNVSGNILAELIEIRTKIHLAMRHVAEVRGKNQKDLFTIETQNSFRFSGQEGTFVAQKEDENDLVVYKYKVYPAINPSDIKVAYFERGDTVLYQSEELPHTILLTIKDAMRTLGAV